MSEIDKAIDKLRRACQCLYLEGEPIIYAADVKARAEAVIDQLNECREENNALRIVNEALDNFNKAIEQRTREACKEKIDAEIRTCGKQINSIDVSNNEAYRNRIKVLEWCKKYAIDGVKEK